MLLALIETCTNSHELAILLKILRGVLWRNALNLFDMNRLKGYEVVASFLQRRADLVNGPVVDELLHIAGFRQTSQSANGLLANAEACRHLILDIRIWRGVAAVDSAKVLQGLQGLLASAPADGLPSRLERRDLNASVLESIGIVAFLCFYMHEPHVVEETCRHVVGTLERFLAVAPLHLQHLHMLAQLLLTGNPFAGSTGGGSPQPLCPRVSSSGVLAMQLISMLTCMLFRLVQAADAQRLQVLCTAFEPVWFAIMFQQARSPEI